MQSVSDLMEILRMTPDENEFKGVMCVALKTAIAALKFGKDTVCLSLAGSFGKRRSVAVAILVAMALRRLGLAKPYLWTPSVHGLLACNSILSFFEMACFVIVSALSWALHFF